MSDTPATDVIVVGVDGSDGSRRAMRWAVEEAQRRKCTVKAVTAWPARDLAAGLTDDQAAEARRRADEVQRHVVDGVLRGRAHSPTVAYELVRGDPVEVLLRASARAQLVVLGSHGTSSIQHAVLGSVSEACSRLASCPVVVVPDQVADQASPADDVVAR